MLIKGNSSLTATMVGGIVLVLCLMLKIALDRRAGVHLERTCCGGALAEYNRPRRYPDA